MVKVKYKTNQQRIQYYIDCVKSDIKYARIFGWRYIFLTRQKKRTIKKHYKKKRIYGASFLGDKKIIKKALVERDGYRCVTCQSRKKQLTIDHIIKRIDGGSNKFSNLQLLCRDCHDKKDN